MQNAKTYITKRFVITRSLATIGFALMLLVSIDIQGSTGLATLDTPTLNWFSVHRSEWLTAVMHTITTLVSAEVLLVLTAIISGVWFWRTRERWRPLLFALSFGGAIGVAWLIKLIVARHRPLPDTMLPPLETGFSLPSIHTFGAMFFVLLLGYLLYSRHQSKRIFAIWMGAAAFTAVVAGVTRLYLGYHWLTDTLASFGLAFIAFAVVITIDTYWQSRKRQLAEPKNLK